MAQSRWIRLHEKIAAKSGTKPVSIDTVNQRYPFSIVWTPIHPISWFLPFIGHMGICDSRGICLDFTGDIGVDNMAFGSPTRYLQLDPNLCESPYSIIHDTESELDNQDCSQLWDYAILEASKDFEHRMHMMICGSDCHSHVAEALEIMRYRGITRWNKVMLAAWLFFCGRYTSWCAIVQTWAGFAVVVVLFTITKT